MMLKLESNFKVCLFPRVSVVGFVMWSLSVCFVLFAVVPVAFLPYMETCMIISKKKQTTDKPTNSIGIGFYEVVGDLCISMCVHSP